MSSPGNRSANYTDADAERLRQYEDRLHDGISLTVDEWVDYRDLLNRENEAWNAQFRVAT